MGEGPTLRGPGAQAGGGSVPPALRGQQGGPGVWSRAKGYEGRGSRGNLGGQRRPVRDSDSTLRKVGVMMVRAGDSSSTTTFKGSFPVLGEEEMAGARETVGQSSLGCG